MQAEGADPEFSSGVDLTRRRDVQDMQESRQSSKATGLVVASDSGTIEQRRHTRQDWTKARQGRSPVRVEDGAACVLLAGDGLVVDQRQVLALLERRVQGSDRDHGPGRVQPRGGPGIEREADSVLVFNLFEVHCVQSTRGGRGCDGWGGRDGRARARDAGGWGRWREERMKMEGEKRGRERNERDDAMRRGSWAMRT